jgi:hypothetical protein
MITNVIGRKSVLAAAVGVALLLPSMAGAAGVGKSCGAFVGPICDQGLWCDPLPGMCGTINPPGKCVKVPEVCIKKKLKSLNPVCACFSKTYGNDCERQMAKAWKDHDGPCK